MCAKCEPIPLVIGDQELSGDDGVQQQTMPHNHRHSVATFSYASAKQLNEAIAVASEAQLRWDCTPYAERYAIWTKAADLMAGKYRQELNAATMLGQGKTVIQAEIDAAAELIDFVRLNAFYCQEATRWTPTSPDPTVTKNSMRMRGLDGFVVAISPFNFTAIGGNLAYTPALMGNAVLWKPSDTAVLSNWLIFKIMREAGVPPGVVNFVPAAGPTFGDTVTKSPQFAGLNFTGSFATFAHLWGQVGENVAGYRNFPRVVGECGGKNFHFVHPSASVCSVVTGTIRSAFEYCGQKCSACSRIYVPESLWCSVRDELLAVRDTLKVGDPADFGTFMGAVIDERAFKRISGQLDYAHKTDGCTVLGGGCYDCSLGWFVEPTIVQVTNPRDPLMTEEIFGPVVAAYVYPDADLEKTIDLVTQSTRYALTGAVYAQDQRFLVHALERFKMAAGNLYLNDKSTGSVVGQQPFGGARHSGTNDKAGGPWYALRWASPQSVKETFVAQNDVLYPYME